MSDDDILRRLAEEAREAEEEERRQLDSRWDGLAADTLTKDDVEALRRQAESSSLGKAALAAFSPLGSEFHHRVAEELRAKGEIGPAPKESPAAGEPHRTRPRWFHWPALAAAAALVLLLILWPGGGAPPLPEYTVTLTGGAPSLRSTPAAEPSPVFDPGNTLRLVLRPEQPVSGPLEIAAYRQRRGELVPWQPPVEMSAQGVVRITGRVMDDLGLGTRDTALVVTLGHPPLPSGEELREILRDRDEASGGTWRAWRFPVTVAPQAPPP